MRKYLIILAMLLFPLKLFAAEEIIIPPEFVDAQGRVCVKKTCSACSLDWLPFVSKNEFRYGCPQVVRMPPCPKEDSCAAYLPKSAFRIPTLEGVFLDNCIEAMFPDRKCILRFEIDKGIAWGCEKKEQVKYTRFKGPVCVRDYKGEYANVAELTRLNKAEEEATLNAQKAARDAEILCLKNEMTCGYVFEARFPPQTNPLNMNYRWDAPKFPYEEQRKCRENPEFNRTRKCAREFTRGQIPKVSAEEDYGLLKAENLERAPKCARYENRHFAQDLVLTDDKSGQLTWRWWTRKKETPDPEKNFSSAADGTILRCKSFALP